MIQMRRKDREMSSEFALEVVDKCEYAVLSMTDLQNEPYAVPLSIVRIGSCIYFHGAKAGKKSEILATNPQVCLVCVGNVKPLEDKFTTEYESAMVFGKISKVSDKEEKTEALRALCMRYIQNTLITLTPNLREVSRLQAYGKYKSMRYRENAKRKNNKNNNKNKMLNAE